MQDEDEISRRANVHVLDGRKARLSADLRVVYGPVVDEPVPERLRALAAVLDRSLAARTGERPPEGDADPESRDEVAEAGTKGA